jgi:hypothetical protein
MYDTKLSLRRSSYDIFLKLKLKCRYSGSLWVGVGRLDSGIPAPGTAAEGGTLGH